MDSLEQQNLGQDGGLKASIIDTRAPIDICGDIEACVKYPDLIEDRATRKQGLRNAADMVREEKLGSKARRRPGAGFQKELHPGEYTLDLRVLVEVVHLEAEFVRRPQIVIGHKTNELSLG